MRALLSRRRSRVLLALLVLVIALRVALPEIVRRVAVDQADKALIGRIEIGNVDLALVRGALTLHDIAVHAYDLPPALAGESDASPAADAKPPLLRAKRLAANFGLLSLFRRLVELETIELDDFAVHLERREDGTLAYPEPVPSEPEPEPEPEVDEPSSWDVLLQAVRLHGGVLGFEDRAVADEAQSFEVLVPAIDAENLALLINAAGVAPGTIALQAGFGGGTIAIESAYQGRVEGPVVDSTLTIDDVAIDSASVYLRDLGWTEVAGRLDASIPHFFTTGGAHTLRGTAALRDATIKVKDLDEPAVSFKRLAVDVANLDLIGRKAEVNGVTLEGLQLVTQPFGPSPLPVVAALLGGSRSPESDAEEDEADPGSTDVPDGTTDEPEPVEAPAPWAWSVGKVALRSAAIAVEGGRAPLTLDTEATVKRLASAADARPSLDVAIKAKNAGTIAVAGDFTIEKLGFEGDVIVDSLSLGAIAAVLPNQQARVLRDGVANLSLDVAAGEALKSRADSVRIAGSVSLEGLDVTGEDPKSFALRCDELAVTIRELLAPGVLASNPAGATQPIELALAGVSLSGPEIVLTRDANGVVLPAELATDTTAASEASTQGAEPAGGAAAVDPAANTPAAEPVAVGAEYAGDTTAAPAARVEVDRLSIASARLRLKDRTVDPVYRATLDPIDLSASDVRWPGPAARDVTLEARGMEGATLTATGDISPDGSRLTAKVNGLPLAQFEPFLATTGYGVSGGTAALTAQVEAGPESYESTSKLVLSGLDVTGGEGDSLFLSEFGVPLTLALSLMTDLQGNIVLDLPVSGDRSGTSLGIGTAVRNTLARAILNAVTSPLKLVGAVVKIGEKPADLTPKPIGFAAGRTAMGKEAPGKIERLAKLLAASPSLAVHLRGEASAADRRRLQEEALRAELEEAEGFIGAIRTLGERGERSAAIEVLRARANGEKAEIPAEYTEWFEQKVNEHTIADGELSTLAHARAALVQERLTEIDGVDASRVVVEPPDPEDLGDARSAVEVRLAAAGAARPGVGLE